MSKNHRDSSDDDKLHAKWSAVGENAKAPRNVAEMPNIVSLLQSISNGSSNQLTQDAHHSVMDALRSYI